jgi:hypothetical protein
MKLLFTLLIAVLFVGCGTETRTDVQIQKRTVTISRTIQQVLAPDHVTIIKLESVTKTVTDENGTQIGSEEVTVKPPEVVGSLAKFVGVAAGLAGGPVAQQVAEKATDWLTTLITGGTLAATTAGTGYVAMKRKTATEDARRRAAELERHRDQLIDSVEAAREELDDEADKRFTKALGVKQDRDLQDYIQERTV